MIDPQQILDRLLAWARFAGQYWSFQWPLTVPLTAILAIVVGLILALWGARLLRTVYVLGFLAAGAAGGIHLARQWEVDVLIGFVLGAGLLALLGYLLFRWWVALTAACVAFLVVAVVGGPWLSNRAEDFADSLWEQATGERYFAERLSAATAPAGAMVQTMTAPAEATDDPGGERPSPIGFLRALGVKVWQEHQPDAARLAVMAGIAAALALAGGLLLPRLTTVIGTTVVGVIALSVGTAVFLALVAPSLWEAVRNHAFWQAVVVGLVFVMSLTFQLRGGRIREVAAAVPAATSG